ncbi:ulp1 protease family, C-terminal catalytic domain-containing protein [Tanacetum coccineum]
MSIEEIMSEKRLIDDKIKDITNDLSYKRFQGEKIDDEYERDCEIKINQLLQDYNGLDIEMRKKERVLMEEKYFAVSQRIKSICNDEDDLIKKLFSMHLEKVKHPRAKDVLNKKPTILRPKWGTNDNDTDCGIFLMMHMEHYNGETANNWNLEFPTEKEGNTLDIIKMRVKLATKILSHEINIHRENISTKAQEFARRNTDKTLRKQMIKEAIKTKKEKQ